MAVNPVDNLVCSFLGVVITASLDAIDRFLGAADI